MVGRAGWHARPKSLIGQATAYAHAQWTDLRARTLDDELSIDNDLSERSLLPQEIGRKDSLFLGSDRVGRRAAVLYSVMGSCKRHHIDPFAYLRDTLARLPTHPVDRLEELMPDFWFASHPSARSQRAG